MVRSCYLLAALFGAAGWPPLWPKPQGSVERADARKTPPFLSTKYCAPLSKSMVADCPLVTPADFDRPVYFRACDGDASGVDKKPLMIADEMRLFRIFPSKVGYSGECARLPSLFLLDESGFRNWSLWHSSIRADAKSTKGRTNSQAWIQGSCESLVLGVSSASARSAHRKDAPPPHSA